MRVFISAGEPSGDLHGASLIGSLREAEPGIEVSGFGGERMEEAGCPLVFPLCELALVGLWEVMRNIRRFRHILQLAEEHLRKARPDAVVMIDYPGFHWWLARTARKLNIPVVYFVPPQHWAWGSWRVRKMRRLVDLVLCSLPFEERWYAQRRVNARFVGHPYFDELRSQQLDGEFMRAQRAHPGEVIAILPGSRSQELHHNLTSQLRAAALIHQKRPDLRFLVACLKDTHREYVEEHLRNWQLPVEAHHGRTKEIIQLAHSCLACSGSVSLELLYRGKPAFVLYRQTLPIIFLGQFLLSCKYISLPNLLADEELYPEYWGTRCPAEQMARTVLDWVGDREMYESLCGKLAALRDSVAEPGACRRAALGVLDFIRARAIRRAG
jgi:lipid-A-disaccharide synthase